MNVLNKANWLRLRTTLVCVCTSIALACTLAACGSSPNDSSAASAGGSSTPLNTTEATSKAATSSQQAEPATTPTTSSIVAPEPAASSTDALSAEAIGNKLVVCLGDSIMEGKVPNYPEPDPWPTFLQQHLGSEWTLVNLGVSSTTVLEGESFTYRSTGNVERAASYAPGVALIMLGTNDSWACAWDEQAFCAELTSMVRALRDSSPHVQVVLMSPTHTFCEQDPASIFHMDDKLIGGAMRQAIERVARETGATYLDMYSFTQDHPEWFPDTVHPNGEGNRAIAAYIYEQLTPPF